MPTTDNKLVNALGVGIAIIVILFLMAVVLILMSKTLVWMATA